jgi:Na+-transporting methylmalonyl-CoA/oxaloacetate decarboxylase gamma subunit
MSESLLIALQITALGMGLVFVAIVLLWGLMAALVRLFADPPTSAQPAETDADAGDQADRKRQAAAVAVAVALRQQQTTASYVFPLPPTAQVSAWQSVTRGRQLKQKGSVR